MYPQIYQNSQASFGCYMLQYNHDQLNMLRIQNERSDPANDDSIWNNNANQLRATPRGNQASGGKWKYYLSL